DSLEAGTAVKPAEASAACTGRASTPGGTATRHDCPAPQRLPFVIAPRGYADSACPAIIRPGQRRSMALPMAHRYVARRRLRLAGGPQPRRGGDMPRAHAALLVVRFALLPLLLVAPHARAMDKGAMTVYTSLGFYEIAADPKPMYRLLVEDEGKTPPKPF